MKADVTGVEKTAIEKAIMAIRDYTHGKTYHIQNATGISQQ